MAQRLSHLKIGFRLCHLSGIDLLGKRHLFRHAQIVQVKLVLIDGGADVFVSHCNQTARLRHGRAEPIALFLASLNGRDVFRRWACNASHKQRPHDRRDGDYSCLHWIHLNVVKERASLSSVIDVALFEAQNLLSSAKNLSEQDRMTLGGEAGLTA
jgi:hypothetical protein